MQKGLSLIFSLSCTLSNLLLANSATAQIDGDGTTDTRVTSDDNGNFTIDQGDRAGDNLFHSFDRFSVPTNGSAVFNNATDITNIFNRVTGGNISNIDGLIEANGSANLFLVNPAGIMFGSNARLDIGGSFLGTTADSILFEDGTFSAIDLDNPPLLTINAPIGLNFRDNPAAIDNQSTASADLDAEQAFDDNLFGIRVPDGKTFALAGGDINADGGGIVAVGGRIELGAVAEAGTIELTLTDDDISFNFPDDLDRGNVFLTNNAGFLVQGNEGGDLTIIANDIEILAGSGLFAGIFSGLGSAEAQAGDLILEATGSVVVTGIVGDNDFSSIFNQVEQDALGNAGLLRIDANNLTIADGAQISGSTNGQGNGANIALDINESLLIDNASDNVNAFTGIFNQVNSTGVGDSGETTITAGNLNMINNSRIQSNIFGVGDSKLLSISGNSLSVNDGSQIQSRVLGIGNSGRIEIDADLVEFSGRNAADFPSGAFSLVDSGGEGNAGGIDITANNLLLSDRSQLLSNTDGRGNAGNVNLQIANQTSLISSSILSEVSAPTETTTGGFGEGGDINITTGSLLLKDGSSLLADTENVGNAGNIKLEIGEQFVLEGEGISQFANLGTFDSQISTTVESQAVGNAGNINISAASILVRKNSVDNLTNAAPFISTTSLGQGRAGIIDIAASNISLEDGVRITAETFSGEGGNIFLNLDRNLTLSGGSSISARAFNDANGGNLTIDTDFIIAFPDGNNDIIANAQRGEGGRININAESILGITERPLSDRTNDINASSEDSSLDGDVVINTSDINPIRGTTELPANPVNADRTVVQACRSDRNSPIANSFIVRGKGGVPAAPIAPLSSNSITANGELISNRSSDRSIMTAKGEIIPARGVVKTKDGRILLTASSTDDWRSPENLQNCNGA